MSAMLHGCLPDTDHNVVTARSGLRYGVWVTTPPGYADTTDELPLVYVTDGNFAVGQTAPLIVSQSDPYLSVAPYVQVSVGYADEEAAAWATLRNRDLVPPGEPVSPEIRSTLEAARESGAMTPEHVEAFLAGLADTHADDFLAFLTDELHPLLRSRYRVSAAGHGLFGYSYGGLFSLYAWLVASAGGTTPFTTVGAGSPGVLGEDSQVFALLRGLPQVDAAAPGPRLHVTLNELEMVGDVPVYRGLARHVLAVVDELHARGRSHLVSKAVLRETHVTGVQASFLSYLKACHVR